MSHLTTQSPSPRRPPCTRTLRSVTIAHILAVCTARSGTAHTRTKPAQQSHCAACLHLCRRLLAELRDQLLDGCRVARCVVLRRDELQQPVLLTRRCALASSKHTSAVQACRNTCAPKRQLGRSAGTRSSTTRRWHAVGGEHQPVNWVWGCNSQVPDKRARPSERRHNTASWRHAIRQPRWDGCVRQWRWREVGEHPCPHTRGQGSLRGTRLTQSSSGTLR